MTKILDAALAYAEKGWPIFPCKFDKSPYINEWQKRSSTDPEKIKGWWAKWPDANIGFSPGEVDMMVLDCDPGYLSKDLLDVEADKTPLQAVTPREGLHLFYRIGEDETVPPDATGKVGKNIDVRSHNSYVLLHPSETKDGFYDWIYTGIPSWRSDEMIRRASSARDKAEDRDSWIIEPDLPENIKNAIYWLENHAKVSIQLQGGDDIAFKTAAHLRSKGISKETALDLMWKHWNDRCEPPWSYEELNVKVNNGYTYATDAPGNYTPEFTKVQLVKKLKDIKMGKDKPEDIDDFQEGRYRFISLSGLKNLKSPEWLVEDFITDDGYTLLYGPPDSFKTFIALDIALGIVHNDVAYPRPGFWGSKIKGEGAVLYAAGEGNRRFDVRVAAWQKYYLGSERDEGAFTLLEPVPTTKFLDKDGGLTKDFDNFITGALKAHKKYKLTVIDTLGRSMQGVTEDKQENASLFTGLVNEIQHWLGGTVLAIHHSGHSEKRARGSSVFQADPDTIIGIEKSVDNRLVNLTMDKQKDDEQWRKPKLMALEKINLSVDLTSLVVRHPTQDEQLRNPKDMLPLINKLIIEKLAEYSEGRKYPKAEMAEYIHSECKGEGVKNELEKIIHDPSQTANRYYRNGNWIS